MTLTCCTRHAAGAPRNRLPEVACVGTGCQEFPWSALKVYEFSIPTFGKGVVYDIDHKIRAEHFRFFGEALKTSKLKEYVPHFVKETEVGRELRCPQQSC